MATQDKHEVTIKGRFSPGTKVGLVPAGSADTYNGAGADAVQTATTNKDGETTFKAEPGRYFAVATEKTWNHITEEHEDRVRSVDVTIHSPAVLEELSPAARAHREAAAPEPPAPSFSPTLGGRIIVGARGTHDLDPGEPTRIVSETTGHVETFASPVTGEKLKTPRGGVRHPRQEDHRGEELASSTLTGEAVLPASQAPKQEDAKKGQKQASDTETGTQAPPREAIRQEDYSGPQASDTQTGEAYPVGEPDTSEAGRRASSSRIDERNKPNLAREEAKGRAGSKKAAKKAAAKKTAANKSKQARAAKKASGTGTQRSKADQTAASQPAEDARGVEHREVPESIGSPKK